MKLPPRFQLSEGDPSIYEQLKQCDALFQGAWYQCQHWQNASDAIRVLAHNCVIDQSQVNTLRRALVSKIRERVESEHAPPRKGGAT